MKRREGNPRGRLDALPEPPLDWDEDDDDFDTVDTLELVVTAPNGSSSRVICVAIEGDTSAATRGASSATRPGAR
jgi:hypothetical protein